MILEDIPNNKFVLSVKNILDGKTKCDTYNLRICFYNDYLDLLAEREKAI